MKALRIRMIGKQDVNDDDYYFTTTNVPCLVDLSNTVIHFYPDEGENEFGGELVIRHYDPKAKNANNKVLRRRRSRRPDGTTPESEPEPANEAESNDDGE